MSIAVTCAKSNCLVMAVWSEMVIVSHSLLELLQILFYAKFF
jgi:hypothetical protein